MHDIEKLKNECPEVNTIDSLNPDEIITLYDYHPWNDEENVDYITFKILNLKKSDSEGKAARHHSVRFFVKALKKSLIPLVDLENLSVCVVPKSTANEISIGLAEILSMCQKELGFGNTNNLLNRIETIPKAATGGARSVHVHKQSIEAVSIQDINGKNILLLDDVTTTGSSLEACKELLMEAGAKQVFMVALGQTR